MRLLLVSVLVALAVGLVAEGAASGAADPQVASVSRCREVGRAKPRFPHLEPPPQTVKRTDHLVAVVRTNCGRFTIALDAKSSPKIVNSFAYLAGSGFYDGVSFYRVAADFVIEGGDPTESGSGGPGYHVVEPPPPDTAYRPGTVAMARTEADPSGWAGSIFFVVVGKASPIRPAYAVLGHVRSGMATVRRIDELAESDETPSQTVRMKSVRIRGA